MDQAVDRWRIEDVVDFEHFAGRAVDGAPDAAERSAARVASDDRRVVFRAWLDALRRDRKGPGATYARARGFVRGALVVAGFVGGGSLVGALLSKHETEPVNAPLFFGATVGVQLAFLVAALVASVVARSRGGPFRDLVLAGVALCARLVERLPGDPRMASHARLADLELRSARLAPLVGLDAVVLAQAFAIAFNVGLLVALLAVYLPFVDLRFGWQSSYAFTASGIATWVDLVAAPWSWASVALVPGVDVIAATRYARGQHADTLPIAAAHAWWPFLVASIAVYGLAARALVAIVATAALRRRLARFAFASPDANALWRRIRGASIVGDADAPSATSDADAARSASRDIVDLLIVDRELDADALRARLGAAARTATMDVDDDAQARDAGPAQTIAVAVGAARDPVVAIGAFLRALASTSSDVTVVVVDASDERLVLWRRFVAIERLGVAVQSI